MTFPFFVYGTLMTGYQNHRTFLAPYRPRVEPARLQGGKLFHLPQGDLDAKMGYPGLIVGDGTVFGELMYLPKNDTAASAALMQALDDLEEYRGPENPANLYERRLTEVHSHAGPVLAWVYWFVGADVEALATRAIAVPDGDWRRFLERTGFTDLGVQWGPRGESSQQSRDSATLLPDGDATTRAG